MKKRLNRRSFLKTAGSTAIGATALAFAHPVLGNTSGDAASFRSAWPMDADRQWPGPEYWSNPLQDWRVRHGRVECFSPGGDRNLALLTRSVSARRGDLSLNVRLGKLDNATLERGCVGFRIGIKNPMEDYRATAIYGQGMDVGINADGRLFIGKIENTSPRVDLDKEIQLLLNATPTASGYRILLRAASADGSHAAEIAREIPDDWLTGGLALVCSSGPVDPSPAELSPIKDFSFYPPHQETGGTMRFWFADWTVAGDKVDEHEDKAYGPILFTLYTASRGMLKLSAQFPPLGNAPDAATLEARDSKGMWQFLAAAKLDPDAWNATFRVPSWDASRDCAYRVVYSMPDARGILRQYVYEGTIFTQRGDIL